MEEEKVRSQDNADNERRKKRQIEIADLAKSGDIEQKIKACEMMIADVSQYVRSSICKMHYHIKLSGMEIDEICTEVYRDA